jgi:tetratricopeptide (TPR) repeat protein
MNRRILALTLLSLALSGGVAWASWYDDYDDGLAAVRKGNWATAVQKMSAAIKGNAKEGDRVRTYGTIMINYHPYYYRGVAYLNTGRYEEAIADFERTTGPGPENLGSLDTLMERAKKQLAASAAPDPEPPKPEPVRPTVTQTAAPVPSQPAVPQIDPALRQRAASAIAAAKQRLQSAQQRKAASSPQYAQAMSVFTDASTRNASVRSNDDLHAVINLAQNAGDLADLAMPPSAPVPTPSPVLATTTPAPGLPKPAAATTTIMQEADYSSEVRVALEEYFQGEFETAARRFEDLARKMPNNGWIHAFLGASQYSVYAFEADEKYRDAALSSFRKAKRLRSWKDGLPSKYFSKRIRKAFSETEG